MFKIFNQVSNRSSFSKGLATEFLNFPDDMILSEGEDDFAVACPACPSYWFGNLLYPKLLPKTDVKPQELFDLWDERVAPLAPFAKKRALVWESESLFDYEFLEDHDEFEVELMLKYCPTVKRETVENHKVVALEKHQWQAFFELHLSVNGVVADDFTRWQREYFTSLQKAASGQQFVIWDGDEVVAAAGLVWQGTTYRYQMVATKQSHRKRGYASAIVAYIRDFALNHGAVDLYIAGLIDTAQAGIYKRAGFKIDGYMISISNDRV